MSFLKNIVLCFSLILFLTVSSKSNAFDLYEPSYSNDAIYEAKPEIEINIDVIGGSTVSQPRLLRFPEYQKPSNNKKIILTPPDSVKETTSKSNIELKPVTKSYPIPKDKPKNLITKKVTPVKKEKTVTKTTKPVEKTVKDENVKSEAVTEVKSNETTAKKPVSKEEILSKVESFSKEKAKETVTTQPIFSPTKIITANEITEQSKEEIIQKLNAEEKVEIEEETVETKAIEQPYNEEDNSSSNSVIPQNTENGIYELSIKFDETSSSTTEDQNAQIKKLADNIKSDESISLRLMSYAKGDKDSASRSRRLSLSRALAVRSKLMDYGIRSTRIEVRALGNAEEGGNQDRMDIYKIKR